MNILLVSATEFEVSPFITAHGLKLQSTGFYSGKANGHVVDCIITGIGMVAITYSLTKILRKSSYELLINVGIAGAFHSELAIGNVVEIVSDRFADLGIDDNGNYKDAYEEKLVKADNFPFAGGWMKNPTTFDFLNALPKQIGITVNTVSGSKERIELMKRKYNPGTESMEGAAFFYVALSESIPFFQIRAISNKVEPRNKKNWNISLAIENINSTLIDTFGRF